MEKNRLEAFSDGVLAIIITIMVLELKVPHGVELAALKPVLPVLLSYVLSFIYVGIYWNNHHHLFQSTQRVSGRILWANLHLLFWLSLFPFVTGWVGENHLAATPTAVYGVVLLMAAIAYYVLQRAIIAQQGRESLLARHWRGLEREALAPALSGRSSAGICPALDCQWSVCARRSPVAGSRPPHRAHAGEATGNAKCRMKRSPRISPRT